MSNPKGDNGNIYSGIVKIGFMTLEAPAYVRTKGMDDEIREVFKKELFVEGCSNVGCHPSWV
jgi:hypothetical protein